MGTSPSLGHELRALWRELPGLVSDRVDLLALELQRAGAALVQVAMLLVAATVLGVTVWLLAWAAAISAMVDAGLSMALALALMLVVNAAAAWWAIARAKVLLERVPLAATFRHLSPQGERGSDASAKAAQPEKPGETRGGHAPHNGPVDPSPNAAS